MGIGSKKRKRKIYMCGKKLYFSVCVGLDGFKSKDLWAHFPWILFYYITHCMMIVTVVSMVRRKMMMWKRKECVWIYNIDAYILITYSIDKGTCGYLNNEKKKAKSESSSHISLLIYLPQQF